MMRKGLPHDRHNVNTSTQAYYADATSLDTLSPHANDDPHMADDVGGAHLLEWRPSDWED